MVGIGDHNEVNEKTMDWLKNGGKALLIETAERLEKELIDRKLIAGFSIDIHIEGERPYENEDFGEFEDEEEIRNWVIPKGVVEYNIDWYGHQGAYFILSELERICVESGVQPVIDKEGAMRMAFVSLDMCKKIAKDKFGEGKLAEPFLVGKGKDATKYLRKDEMEERGESIEEKRRKNPDTGYLFDPELGHIRIECPELEDGKWLVYLGKGRDFDTLIVICTDKDIRLNDSNVVRAYKIQESELGDSENIIICEDLSIDSRWERFRENDKSEKKYNEAYKELKKEGRIPTKNIEGDEDLSEEDIMNRHRAENEDIEKKDTEIDLYMESNRQRIESLDQDNFITITMDKPLYYDHIHATIETAKYQYGYKATEHLLVEFGFKKYQEFVKERDITKISWPVPRGDKGKIDLQISKELYKEMEKFCEEFGTDTENLAYICMSYPVEYIFFDPPMDKVYQQVLRYDICNERKNMSISKEYMLKENEIIQVRFQPSVGYSPTRNCDIMDGTMNGENVIFNGRVFSIERGSRDGDVRVQATTDCDDCDKNCLVYVMVPECKIFQTSESDGVKSKKYSEIRKGEEIEVTGYVTEYPIIGKNYKGDIVQQPFIRADDIYIYLRIKETNKGGYHIWQL